MLLSLRHWFSNPLGLGPVGWTVLAGLLPLLAVVAWLARRRRRRLLEQLGAPFGARPFAARRSWLRFLVPSGLVSVFVLLLIGIAGPQWGRDWDEPPAPGRDVVVVLDLSRSMLAEDVLPSRAGRARQALEDLVRVVQQHGGHRLGLVAFAARARVVCPLTNDYDHFRLALAELDPANPPAELRPGPGGAASGTRIGAGLREAVALQDSTLRGYQDILLLSDGDDPAQDNEWQAGVQAARAAGIPVHTVGVGDPDRATSIPTAGGRPLTFNRAVVQTRLEEQPLREIARLTGGTYTPAGTSTLPLGSLFLERIESKPATERNEDVLPLYRQHASGFFVSAFLLLALDLALGRRRTAE